MATPLDELPKLAAPATRALSAAGYKNLREFIDVDHHKLACLHGVGLDALRILDEALSEHGHSFRG